jgi:hypothetical protein
MRFLAFLVALMVGFHRPAHAQREYSQLTAGPFSYTWSNEWSVVAGDTLLVREVLLNPTDTLLIDYRNPCESLSTNVPLASEAKTCSPQKPTLSPGDSIWAEIRGVVAAPAPGKPQRKSLGPPSPPFLRIPVVLEFPSHLGGYRLEEVEIRTVVGRAVHTEDFDFMPVFMSVAAAQAVAGEIPYLVLTLRTSAEQYLDLRACWIGPDETKLGGSCQEQAHPMELPNPYELPSPFVLGVEVYEEVTRAIALRRSIDVQGKLDLR